MKPQFPFRCGYIVTQGYGDNANSYPEGHHGAIDILPLDNQGRRFPAPIYPIFDGEETGIFDTDVKKGKGVWVKTKLDEPLTQYCKMKGVVPKDHIGAVYLFHLYWHCLDVTDEDGHVDQDTQIALAGNTGWVFSEGSPVPDDQKGKPPYPGLHLHHEHILKSDTETFNLDKDPRGRIDPFIILNYKPMSNVLLVKKGDEYGFYVPATLEAALIDKALNFGYPLPTLDNGNKVDWQNLKPEITVDK